MHYYLYQTRNTVNNKVYIGVHQTEDLDDGYLGSGVALQRAIEKYGRAAFEKTILETFESAEAMYAREAEVVDEVFIAREDVYNLRAGGKGGWNYDHDFHEKRLAGLRLSNKRIKATFAAMQHQQRERNSQFGTRWITNGAENAKIHKDQPIPEGWWLGRRIRG